MKKRALALIVMFALVLTAVFALVACKPEEEVPPTPTKHKVTFYEKKTKVHEEEVEDGKTVAKYTYTKEGETFVGWYEDSTFVGDPFDFTKPIKGATQLYAKWQKDTADTDTRIWYVMGNTVNPGWDCPTVLNDGKWEVVESLKDAILTQKEGTNEFSITLTMRAGTSSKFRFATQLENKTTWEGAARAQAGIGNIAGFEFAAGNNPNGGAEETLESKRYGNVKKDDAIIFEGGREFDDSPLMWNIFVTADSEGVYKFTLTTFPGEDERDTIAWEKVGEVEKLDKTFVPIIAGSMQGWKADAENGFAMTDKDVNSYGEGKWIYIFNIDSISADKAKEEFKVVNIASGQEWLGNAGDGKLGEGGNFEITENGTWMIAIDSVAKTYKLEKAAIRVVGTIDGQGWADGSQRGDGYKDNMYVMNKVDSATEGVEKYELVLEITAEHAASWLDAGKVAAIKVDFCACGYTIWDCGAGENGASNIELTELGWYKVTLELSYGADNARTTNVTVDKTTAPDYAAKIGVRGYNTLEEAIAAAKADATIVLQKDVVVTTNIVVDKKITLDLNGKTISNTVAMWDDTDGIDVWSLISVRKNGELTITGNGKVDALADDVFAVDVRNGGKLVIENGEFIGNLHSVYVLEGSAVINGGKYDLKQLDKAGNGHNYTLNLFDASHAAGTATITVTGGQFVEYNPAESNSEHPAVSFLAKGYEATSATVDGKTIYTVGKIMMDATNVSIKDYATTNGFENSKQYETLDGINAVTVTAHGVNSNPQYGSNTAKYYENDASKDGVGNWRIYQNENPTITITAKTGYNITSVKITYTVSNTGVLLLGEDEVASDAVVNVTDNTITFTVGNTGDKTNGQVRIIAIAVVYAPVAAAE